MVYDVFGAAVLGREVVGRAVLGRFDMVVFCVWIDDLVYFILFCYCFVVLVERCQGGH